MKISPSPSLPKRGIFSPPFGKGRLGGILQINSVTILRLLIGVGYDNQYGKTVSKRL
jgi:hypothetical protein